MTLRHGCALSVLFFASSAHATEAPRVHEAIHPLSPRHLLVELDAEHSPSGDPSDWTLTSATHTAYQEGLSPAALSVASRAAELIPEGWPYPSVLEHRVVLELSEPLKAGEDYTLETGSSLWELPFDPEQDWSPSLKVNQVGYRADAPERWAYLSHWLVGLDPLELSGDELAFRVIDAASGETALTGELALRLAWDVGSEDAYGNNYSQANVWQADLSSLDQPGTYYILWDGVGRSWPFSVRDDTFDEPFRTVFRALYHQRCGTSVEPELTDWSHQTCHQHPVQLTDADYYEVGADAFSDLPAATTGDTLDAWGGYHDAGDYDRRIEHLVVVDSLVDLYELFPQRFAGDDLGIPESGNGLPDVLDEARWALDLYAQLQGEEGGVRAGVETTGYPDWGTQPEDDPFTDWYAYAEDPISTFRFAGASAKLSRALEAWDADASALWLERAQHAFSWGQSNRATGYDDTTEAAYAAAELLRSTGDPTYDQAFRDNSVFAAGLDYSPYDWDVVDVRPLWAYSQSGAADPTYQQAAADLVVSWADRLLVLAEDTGYRRVNQHYQPISFGSGSTPVEAALLVAAHQLTGDVRYLAWLTVTADVSLGANQAGLSYVTGLGTRSVEQPLQLPSMGDGIDAPVPGLTVFGPAYYTEDGGILGSAIDAYSPAITNWPIAERFVDVGYVPAYNEFTVQSSIAPTLLAFGYLAQFDPTGDTEDTGDTGDSEGPRDPGGCGCSARPSPGALLPLALLSLTLLLTRRRPGVFIGSLLLSSLLGCTGGTEDSSPPDTDTDTDTDTVTDTSAEDFTL